MNENKSLILMVEDEEQVLNTNCRMLRRRGYDVRTAQTVSEVYHQLEEQLPDTSHPGHYASGRKRLGYLPPLPRKNHEPCSFSHRKKRHPR